MTEGRGNVMLREDPFVDNVMPKSVLSLSGAISLARAATKRFSQGAQAVRERFPGGAVTTRELHWVFLATLPGAGSTAFAELARSSSGVRSIGRRGEGQWLIPELSAPGQRWNPDLLVDYQRLRSVWIEDALKQGPGPAVVFEKSPPSIVRMRKIVEVFLQDASVDVIGLTRDPIAVCASWASRYRPAVLAQSWAPGLSAEELEDESLYYRTLGRLCGERMEILAGLDDLVRFWVSYEDLTERTDETIWGLTRAIPALKGIDPAHSVKVKDYALPPLRNMNDEQRSKLTQRQIAEISEGLTPYKAAIERFGYRLSPGHERERVGNSQQQGERNA